MKTFRTLSRWAGSPLPFSLLKPKSDTLHIFPFYHSVSDMALPHLTGLYPVCDVNRFSSDLEFLLRHYHPLSFEDLKCISSGDSIKKEKPGFFLTFDDGLREMADRVAPLLYEKGLEAIFFVNPAFVDNREMFYRHKISLLLDILTKPSLKGKAAEMAGVAQCPQKELHQRLTSRQPIDDGMLMRLARAADLDFNHYLATMKPYLEIDQLKLLLEKGFRIGSHSYSHPEFASLSDEERKRQLTTSFGWLEDTLCVKEKLFSFPYTDFSISDHFFRWMHNDLGVQMSFGTAGIKHEKYRQHFQRIAMEHPHLKSARSILKEEYAYYRLKSLVGKNRITRR